MPGVLDLATSPYRRILDLRRMLLTTLVNEVISHLSQNLRSIDQQLRCRELSLYICFLLLGQQQVFPQRLLHDLQNLWHEHDKRIAAEVGDQE